MQKILKNFFGPYWKLWQVVEMAREAQHLLPPKPRPRTYWRLLQALREQVGARTSDVASWILLDPLDLPVKRSGQEGVGRLCQVEAETSSRRETGALAQTQGDQEDQSY